MREMRLAIQKLIKNGRHRPVLLIEKAYLKGLYLIYGYTNYIHNYLKKTLKPTKSKTAIIRHFKKI